MVFKNEQDLIVQLKKGDSGAVSLWYSSAKADLLRFFIQRMGNEADAQELVHDTYLSCLSSLPLFRGESGLWTFMISIARHELSDYWRKRYAKKAIGLLPYGQELLESLSVDTKDHFAMGATGSQVSQIMHCLPEEIGELLQLKYIDGLSVKELAAHYGLSFAAMQSKLHRAKELFKQEYERTTVS